jgi:trehalose 6-phosphate synthase/phosphatase
MNLVAKEFVASKPKRSGVLILSSTAGAADELHDALIVNPGQPKSLIAALEQSLSMSRSESRMRLERMQAYLKEHTIYAWADSFMATLEQPVPAIHPRTKQLNTTKIKMIAEDYQKAQQRLILLAYDGVLEPFASDFEATHPSSDVLKLLQKLGLETGNRLVVISGRNPTNLLDWFGDLPIDLAAEHGILIRQKDQIDWQVTAGRDSAWQTRYRPILEKYANMTPGAKVETKQYGLVWHYRAASPYFAQKNLVIMKKALKTQLKIDGLEMRSGKKILEIRPVGTSKGKATTHWLHDDLDFILAIGDDYTDEDTFRALPSSAYTIKVGKGRTLAQFRIANVDQVIAFLKVLSKN